MFHRDVWKSSTQHWEIDYMETWTSWTKKLLSIALLRFGPHLLAFRWGESPWARWRERGSWHCCYRRYRYDMLRKCTDDTAPALFPHHSLWKNASSADQAWTSANSTEFCSAIAFASREWQCRSHSTARSSGFWKSPDISRSRYYVPRTFADMYWYVDCGNLRHAAANVRSVLQVAQSISRGTGCPYEISWQSSREAFEILEAAISTVNHCTLHISSQWFDVDVL